MYNLKHGCVSLESGTKLWKTWFRVQRGAGPPGPGRTQFPEKMEFRLQADTVTILEFNR